MGREAAAPNRKRPRREGVFPDFYSAKEAAAEDAGASASLFSRVPAGQSLDEGYLKQFSCVVYIKRNYKVIRLFLLSYQIYSFFSFFVKFSRKLLSLTLRAAPAPSRSCGRASPGRSSPSSATQGRRPPSRTPAASAAATRDRSARPTSPTRPRPLNWSPAPPRTACARETWSQSTAPRPPSWWSLCQTRSSRLCRRRPQSATGRRRPPPRLRRGESRRGTYWLWRGGLGKKRNT